ncbi:MAG: hypothetical protein U0736_10490 [Gemmataceae bacterium]
MSHLLEDLAEETSVSIVRTANRLDAEVQDLERVRQEPSPQADRVKRIVEAARQSTEHVLSCIPQTEGVWRSSVAALRTLSAPEAERLLRQLISLFESGLRLARCPRRMWLLAEPFQISPDRLDELERTERRFAELADEAKAALEHRIRGWQPADPLRLAQGMQQALDGKTTRANEAIARFRRPSSQGLG